MVYRRQVTDPLLTGRTSALIEAEEKPLCGLVPILKSDGHVWLA